MTTIFDIIILGSGIGGLETASILSKKGYKVCVLEKNPQLGGTLQGFQFQSSHFETGMHYLGSLDEGQVLHKIFSYLNIYERLPLKRMDEDGFDIFNIQGKEYAYAMGLERFGDQLSNYFPNDTQAIRNYTKSILDVVGSNDVYRLHQPVSTSIFDNPYIGLSAYRHINSLTMNSTLRQVLSAQNFIYAGEKESAPFYVHALINNYFLQSAYRVVGGSFQIADLLAEHIRSFGGEIHTRKEAVGFGAVNGKLISVKTSDGDEFYGKQFISNFHPAQTLDLLDPSLVRKVYANRIKSIENTISSFSLHLKLKENSFPFLNHNYQYFKGNDVWKASSYKEMNWPDYYFLSTAPDQHSQAFASSASVLTYMKYEEVARWEQRKHSNTWDTYKEWKQQKSEDLIELLAERFPDIKSQVVSYDASTPLTFKGYIGNADGSMYGSLRDYRDPLRSYITPKTKIPNLYFTGQNINLHGMLGVSLSTLLTCGEFVGLNQLIKEVNEA